MLSFAIMLSDAGASEFHQLLSLLERLRINLDDFQRALEAKYFMLEMNPVLCLEPQHRIEP